MRIIKNSFNVEQVTPAEAFLFVCQSIGSLVCWSVSLSVSTILEVGKQSFWNLEYVSMLVRGLDGALCVDGG